MMDRKDVEIIELLRGSARMKNTEVARRIGLTEGAIRARIAAMVRKGVIRRFTVETEPVGVEGIILIESGADRSKEVVSKLKTRYDRVFETSGGFDAAVQIRATDMDQLNATVDQIREIPGIVRTSTLIRLA